MRNRFLLVLLPRVRYLVLAFVALAAALGVASSPATAQTTTCTGVAGTQYPPTAPSLSVSQTQVAPGGVVQVTGRCCPPNSLVTLTYSPGNVPLGTAQTGADGSFSANVAVPPTAAPGTGTITATSPGCSASTNVNVLGEAIDRTPGGKGLPGGSGPGGGAGPGSAPQTKSNLAKTGAGFVIPFGLVGLLLIAVGSLAVVAVRRRATEL